MAFKKPTVNTITTDLKLLTIYLRSTIKWGKTTLFRDVIMEKYGDPKCGFLVRCGLEQADTLLDNLNTSQIKTYKELIEMKDWLISKKGVEHNIQIVCFDTVDELVPIFEKETIRQSNILFPAKKVKTINAAMNGYQVGQNYTADLIRNFMSEIHEAGYGVWILAHTKFKTIREKGGVEEDGYMQLTSNLVSTYETVFGGTFDVVLTGTIDRAVETIEKQVGDKMVTKRYARESVRKLHFRESPLISAGGRFKYSAVPEFLIFNEENMGKEFIRVVEEGIEKCKSNYGKKEPTQETEATLKENLKETNKKLENDVAASSTNEPNDSTEYPENLLEVIKTKFKACIDKDIKEKVKEIISRFGKLSDVSQDGLTQIYDILSLEIG